MTTFYYKIEKGREREGKGEKGEYIDGCCLFSDYLYY
jgi:hypothetical protein